MAIKPEDALRLIAEARGGAICVPTMTTSPAWRTLAPHARRVLVLDGDGSLLMQLGSLATIAGARPRNFVHFVFKNGVYHTSGSQEIPGGLTVDFVTMARGAGYRSGLS